MSRSSLGSSPSTGCLCSGEMVMHKLCMIWPAGEALGALSMFVTAQRRALHVAIRALSTVVPACLSVLGPAAGTRFRKGDACASSPSPAQCLSVSAASNAMQMIILHALM